MSFRPTNRLPTGLPIGIEGYEPVGGWPAQPPPQPGQTIYIPPTQAANGTIQPASFLRMQNSLHGLQVPYPGGMPSFQLGTAPPMYWSRNPPAPTTQPRPATPSPPSSVVSSLSKSDPPSPKRRSKHKRRSSKSRRRASSPLLDGGQREARSDRRTSRWRAEQDQGDTLHEQAARKSDRKTDRRQAEGVSDRTKPDKDEKKKGKGKERADSAVSSSHAPSSASEAVSERLARPAPETRPIISRSTSSIPSLMPRGRKDRTGSLGEGTKAEGITLGSSKAGPAACPPAPRLQDGLTVSSSSALYPRLTGEGGSSHSKQVAVAAHLSNPPGAISTRDRLNFAAGIIRPPAPGPSGDRQSRLDRPEKPPSDRALRTGPSSRAPSEYTTTSVAFGRIPSVSDGLPPTSQYSNRSQHIGRPVIERDSSLDHVERLRPSEVDGRTRIITVKRKPEEQYDDSDEDDIQPCLPYHRTPDTVMIVAFPDEDFDAKVYLSQSFIMMDSPNRLSDMWLRGRRPDKILEVSVRRPSSDVFGMFYDHLVDRTNVVPLSIYRLTRVQGLCYGMNGPFEILYREALFWNWQSVLQHIYDFINAKRETVPKALTLQKYRELAKQQLPQGKAKTDESLTAEEAEALEYYLQSLKGVRSWLERQQHQAFRPPEGQYTPFIGTDWDYGRLVVSEHRRTGDLVAHIRYYDNEINRFLYARIGRGPEEESMGEGARQAVVDWTSLREACDKGKGGNLAECLGFGRGHDRTKPRGVQVLFQADWCMVLERPKMVVINMYILGWWKRGKKRIKSQNGETWSEAGPNEKWYWPLQIEMKADEWSLTDQGEVQLAFQPSRPEVYPIPADGDWMKANPYC